MTNDMQTRTIRSCEVVPAGPLRGDAIAEMYDDVLDVAIARGPSARFTMEAGDVFLLASGRCLHRIAPIEGDRARVTLGGFLAFDKTRTRVLYWS